MLFFFIPGQAWGQDKFFFLVGVSWGPQSGLVFSTQSKFSIWEFTHTPIWRVLFSGSCAKQCKIEKGVVYFKSNYSHLCRAAKEKCWHHPMPTNPQSSATQFAGVRQWAYCAQSVFPSWPLTVAGVRPRHLACFSCELFLTTAPIGS